MNGIVVRVFKKTKLPFQRFGFDIFFFFLLFLGGFQGEKKKEEKKKKKKKKEKQRLLEWHYLVSSFRSAKTNFARFFFEGFNIHIIRD